MIARKFLVLALGMLMIGSSPLVTAETPEVGCQCPYYQEQGHDFVTNGDKFVTAGAEVRSQFEFKAEIVTNFSVVVLSRCGSQQVPGRACISPGPP
jgi:hypothetical protein